MTLFEGVLISRVNQLLEMLNEDLKPKEKYMPIAHFTEKGYEVFVCANKDKDLLLNILDFEGNIPNGFCANWRNYQHIKQELK